MIEETPISDPKAVPAREVEVRRARRHSIWAEASCIKRIPDIAKRDPLVSRRSFDTRLQLACDRRPIRLLDSQLWPRDDISWPVKLMHCQNVSGEPAWACCEFALDPGSTTPATRQ